MMFRNSRRQWFQSSSAGCYPVNDRDPQNEVDDFDEDAENDKADAQEEDAWDRRWDRG
jgi:hypothetical protein